ncbi:hypothetical protein ACFVT5_34685 [Streptomyces sp. NPDC058001]|uniref:hypothetical protein n=1 Tax=Streptomyces sp. NPDC058001 TaxID=3346300 RepID=UPI0036E2F659
MGRGGRPGRGDGQGRRRRSGDLFALGAACTISSFGDAGRPGPDIGILLELAARGRLAAEVGWRGSWERAGDAFRALLAREVVGKAVLDVRAS